MLQLEHSGFINSHRPREVTFGLKQMEEGDMTCARCPKSELSHKLDVMHLKCILQRALIFSAEKFYSADIHYHNKVLRHVENVGNTLKKLHLIM